jgi:hypothetical protein
MTGFYTYMHMRQSDGQVFYVGKGRGGRANSTYNLQIIPASVNLNKSNKFEV